MDYAVYQNPLCARYAGEQMQCIFSPQSKFSTWRRLWLALASAEQRLGLPITDTQLSEMRAHLDDINFSVAEAREREVRHDVMAHIYAFAQQCPTAAPIIHLGATSSYIGDNADIILMDRALGEIKRSLINAIASLARFAEQYAELPVLSYTHLQPAQPTTLGKRATLWINDLLLDLEALEFTKGNLKLLGCKGATGTAASFLDLFGGDAEKVLALERSIAGQMGFKDRVVAVSGQTYSRKVDYGVLSVLSGVAQSAAKFATDIRLLMHMRELGEPFEQKQVGSSAMAYKQNPMRSERVVALSRYLINLAQNPAFTAAEQWLERTLDDSANRRLAIPESFLCADAILALVVNIANGLRVFPATIAQRLGDQLPFLMTETVLMRGVAAGGDRQVLHEVLREHSLAASAALDAGEKNDLLARIAADSRFNLTLGELEAMKNESDYTGMAAAQTRAFLAGPVDEVLTKNQALLGPTQTIEV